MSSCLLRLNGVQDEEDQGHKEHQIKTVLHEAIRLVHKVPLDVAVPKETPEGADVRPEQDVLVLRLGLLREVKDTRQSVSRQG